MIWLLFLDLDSYVTLSSAFDGNNLNESFLSNRCQVMTYKNLTDYICINCLALEKTIPLWDEWKSRLWHVGNSRNVLLGDNISFHWQEHVFGCVLGTETPASLEIWKRGIIEADNLRWHLHYCTLYLSCIL